MSSTNTPTTRETADHAELARLRQHIANLKLRPGHHVQFGTPSVSQISNYWNRDLAADLEALLSEIAALRGERDTWKALAENGAGGIIAHIDRATQAERQRDELRKAIPDLSSVIAWLDNGCEPKHAVTELAIYKARIDQALANQGVDQ
ncbi:hypothetical protein D3C86_1208480 [compost metagenome]